MFSILERLKEISFHELRIRYEEKDNQKKEDLLKIRNMTAVLFKSIKENKKAKLGKSHRA